MNADQEPIDDGEVLPNEPDEINEVLAGLKALRERATMPIVRACLEDAHDDIAHLTGRDPLQSEAA
jgi:hypothetical protein